LPLQLIHTDAVRSELCSRIKPSFLLLLFTGESYYFVFEKWFAVEKEDGKVEREVMAADRGLGFSKVGRQWCLFCLRHIDIVCLCWE